MSTNAATDSTETSEGVSPTDALYIEENEYRAAFGLAPRDSFSYGR